MTLAFSLIIPCYNEAANLPALAARIREVFVRGDVEVILVDNGSTDDSPAVLAAIVANGGPIRSVRVEKNQGYGFGILSGLAAAKGAVLGWTHADMQTDPKDALTGLALFDTADPNQKLFVKGARRGRPLSDVIFTMGMAVFEMGLLWRTFWDINAQPTLFTRGFYEAWKDPPHDFSLDLFAYHAAKTQGLIVKRFPVVFGKRLHGVSHWNINWKAKMKFIRRTLDYSYRLRKNLG